ncbi:cytochrome P450 [Octadecabacter sp.]|nr:cytochrome P450 [Octadecabacter sp.]
MTDLEHLSNPNNFSTDSWISAFSNLRMKSPIHYVSQSPDGAYWSIVGYEQITSILNDWENFSSTGGVTIEDQPEATRRTSFIKRDPPAHTRDRKEVATVLSTHNLNKFKGRMSECISTTLDNLPAHESFDWVQLVANELSSKMLATMLNVSSEDRHKLIAWADLALFTDYAAADAPVSNSVEKFDKLREMADYFAPIWKERQSSFQEIDLISALARKTPLEEMSIAEFIGQMNLLLIGGFDTIRNTISSSLIYVNKYPLEVEKVRLNPKLLPCFIAEIIRLHSPLIHLRRTAVRDVEVSGRLICKGNKVVLWLISGNRDESKFENPNRLKLTRGNFRRHLSFGSGVHRCPGAQLAELQTTMLWDEIMRRNLQFQVLKPAVMLNSNFSRGIKQIRAKMISA